MPKDYEIKYGDTLSELAQRFGVSQSALARYNEIEDPDKIYAGETLRVPSVARPEPDAQTAMAPAFSSVLQRAAESIGEAGGDALAVLREGISKLARMGEGSEDYEADAARSLASRVLGGADASPVPALGAEAIVTRPIAPLTNEQESRFKIAMINEGVDPFLTRAMLAYGITEPRDVAGFLANVKAESSLGKHMREFTDEAEAGRYVDAEGNDWRGRAHIQLTGRTNFEHMARLLDRPDILENPDLLEDPAIGAMASAAYWVYGQPRADGSVMPASNTPQGWLRNPRYSAAKAFEESMIRVTGAGARSKPDQYFNKRYKYFTDYSKKFEQNGWK